MSSLTQIRCNLLVFCFTFLVLCSNSISTPAEDEGQALLTFKNGADVNNKLNYTASDYCQWQGVRCINGSVVNYQIEDLNLQGNFPPNSLSKLLNLKIINLNGNSFSGPIPDISPLTNLKSLFLSKNHFSGSFPPSILILEKLMALALSSNNLTGTLPVELIHLKKLIILDLSFNHFSGSFPPLNQAHLKALDISNNNFSGALPNTKTLSHFKPICFSNNSYLCGEIIHIECPYHYHHHHHELMVALIIIFVIFAIICVDICAYIVIKRTNKSRGGVGIGNKFKKHLEMVGLHHC